MTRVALVTAASRGMGRAVAEKLHAEGWALGLLARSDDIHDLAASLGAIAVAGSVTSPDDLHHLCDAAMERYGRIDAVVANTGHAAKGELLALSDDDWRAGLDLLLLNTIRLARFVTPVMEGQGGGAIVNISTFGAVEPSLSFPISSAIRAALGAFTTMFAARHGPANVRMNNVLPGFVNTYPESNEILTEIPAGRYADAAEVAELVAFLCSDRAAYINGQSIRIDGGMSRSV